MNLIFDRDRAFLFHSLKELVTSNKLVGRRKIKIEIDEKAIEELINYEYKAEMYDKDHKELLRITNEVNKIKSYLKKLEIDNQSDIRYNHYTIEDIIDTIVDGTKRYKVMPISLLAVDIINRLDKIEKGDIIK